MDITLPDGRKATVIGEANKDMVRILLEDGREAAWPKDKLPPPPGEETLKVVRIPAIERLEELLRERDRLERSDITIPGDDLLKLIKALKGEALNEFQDKWGLT